MEKTVMVMREEEVQTSDTAFLEVMGASPINKVLGFLIENERASWSMNEISENANVGYSTLKIVLPKMLKNKLLFVDKRIGKIKLYKINKENEIIKFIVSIYKTIEKRELRKFKEE